MGKCKAECGNSDEMPAGLARQVTDRTERPTDKRLRCWPDLTDGFQQTEQWFETHITQ